MLFLGLALAKEEAARSPNLSSHHPAKAYCRRKSREEWDRDWRKKWTEASGSTTARADFYRFITSSHPTSEPSPQLHWGRADLLRLVQARTGRGDFAAYHQRFRYQEASLLCPRCSRETSRSHPFFCPSLEVQQHQILVSEEGIPLTIKQILDCPNGSSAFLNFISSTDAFQPTPQTHFSL